MPPSSAGEERPCASCSKPFRSRWGYARCGSCRYQESYKDACPCGDKKEIKEKRCRQLKETITTGRVASYIPRNPKHKPSWMVTVQRRGYLIWLLDQVAPVLCSRRREAAARLLSNFKDSPTLPDARDLYGTLSDAEACAWLAGVVEGDGVIRPGDRRPCCGRSDPPVDAVEAEDIGRYRSGGR